MADEKKMTRKEAIEWLKGLDDVKANEEVSAILDKWYAQVTKPREKQEGPTKVAQENLKFAEKFAEVIRNHGEHCTGAYLAEHVKGLPSTTPQKIRAIVGAGMDAGILVREREGKTVYYNVA